MSYHFRGHSIVTLHRLLDFVIPELSWLTGKGSGLVFSIFSFNGFQYKVAMPLKCPLPKVNESCLPCCFNYGIREKRQIHTFARALLKKKKMNVTDETGVWTRFVDFTLISQNGYAYCILLKKPFFRNCNFIRIYRSEINSANAFLKSCSTYESNPFIFLCFHEKDVVILST